MTKLILLSNLFSLSVLALGTDGLYFFRSPQSQFPSGQASQNTLAKNKVRTVTENTYLVNRDKKTFWIAAEKVLRADDLEDHTAYNVIPSSVRKGPDWSTESLMKIPPRTRLEILKIENSWAKVKFQSVEASLIGYVDLNNLIVKADFASFAMTDKNEWRPIKYRELAHLVTDTNDRIPIDQIQKLRTRSELGIVLIRDDKLGLSLKNHVSIQKTEGGSWVLSELKGHGLVYWKNQMRSDIIAKKPETEEIIDTEALLKKEIHNVAFHPKNPKWGLASADGVYLTNDGENWRRLPQFQKQTHPVSIDQDGTLIVGSFQSKNFGKSFSSYIRWEKIARLIEINDAKPPQVMNLIGTNYDENGFLVLTIDNGSKKIKVRGLADEPNSWLIQSL